MNHENYILEALEKVLIWDLPDEDIAQAVNDQARLMSGVSPDEEAWEDQSDIH